MNPPPITRHTLQPMEGKVSLGSCLEHLLKKPGQILHECLEGNRKVLAQLLLAAVLGLAAYGLLVGSFSGGAQWWAAPLKVVVGALISGALCIPSLYILLALSGATVRLSSVVALVAAALALTGVLLAGFAPVLWVFSQSTTSLAFVGFLTLAFWLISLFSGARLILHAQEEAAPKAKGSYIALWLLIFMLVTLQMSTALRPIVGSSTSLLPEEKRFFGQHWVIELEGLPEGSSAKSSGSAKKADTSWDR
jgi:hypothetical protein